MLDFYIYRNFTLENLFKKFKAQYSGYGDVSETPEAKNYIWFYLPSIKNNQQELLNEVNDFQNKFQLVFSKLENKTVIALTTEVLFSIEFENSNVAIKNANNAFNSMLYETAKTHTNLKIIDFSDFVRQVPIAVLDWKYYYISQSLISPKLNANFHDWFSKKLDAIQSKRKKCLVLDCDNTLWGGILGEDGIEGIQIGETYPGLAFRDFQAAILEAANYGVILAVCSKNSEEDVLEVFEKHPNQLLKQKHISAYRINWNDKATNIQELAVELNIGLDSMVFIDDNPAERARVQQMLPEVEVPEFPDKPYLLSSFFKTVYEKYFQVYQLTTEDKSKTHQYTANAERNVFKKNFTDVDVYLESLEMELKVYFADKFTIARIAQMTQKTNQFNLTTRRYSESELKELIENDNLVLCLNVKDKFGDNGITVAAILILDRGEAVIENFLLSCRILGRGIETAFVDYILNYLKQKGITNVFSRYVPTKKNKQTENFYEKNGFVLRNTQADGTKNYDLELRDFRKIKNYYRFSGESFIAE